MKIRLLFIILILSAILNCSKDAADPNPDPLELTLNPTHVSTFGGSDGAIDLTATGGSEPYQFAWSNGETTEDISNLAAGPYTVTVTDAESQSETESATITQPGASGWEYLGQEPPGDTPVLFGPPEIMSNDEWFWHGAPAFSPDFLEFHLDLYNPNEGGIQSRYMEYENNQWSAIKTASFAANMVTGGLSFTDNGNKVFFVSDRAGAYSGGIWYALRTAAGWTEPVPQQIPWNASLGGGWRISLTSDEKIYAHLFTNGGNGCNIYKIDFVDGQYIEPEELGNNVNSEYMDINAFIDPGESYLIFTSSRPGGYGGTDLYISFKENDDSWSPAQNMGNSINSVSAEGEPYVSADNNYLFFLSERGGDRNPYWVDAQIIEDLRPGNLNSSLGEATESLLSP